MGKFQSSKIFDGFSTVFRQWKAKTHVVNVLKSHNKKPVSMNDTIDMVNNM